MPLNGITEERRDEIAKEAISYFGSINQFALTFYNPVTIHDNLLHGGDTV